MSKQDPVLGVKITRPNQSIKAQGGLNYLRGNHAPYFSLTGEEWVKGRLESCGCLHELILEHFPHLADLAALHLSDIDGIPSHAESNGWYWLAGALTGNAGEKYHGGGSKRHFPKPESAFRRGEWDNTDYREPTQEESLAIFARQVRISVETARTVRDRVEWLWRETRVECSEHKAGQDVVSLEWSAKSWRMARIWFKGWIEEQRPRWKREALACIAKHGLVVYGDTWQGKIETGQETGVEVQADA